AARRCQSAPLSCCPVRCRRALPTDALPRQPAAAPARTAAQSRRASTASQCGVADRLLSVDFVDECGTSGHVPLATRRDHAPDPTPLVRPCIAWRPGG